MSTIYQLVLEVHKFDGKTKEIVSVDITPLHDMLTAQEIFELETTLNSSPELGRLRFHISLNQLNDETKKNDEVPPTLV